MSIDARCGGCGRKFQARDELAGKRVKCPHCSGTIHVGRSEALAAKPEAAKKEPSSAPRQPDSAPPPWYVITTDDEQLGPMPKAQLDALVAQGRLDAFCRIRPEGADQWSWVEDVYPDLAARGEPDAASDGAEPRLQPCPDCGKMVSRRASQCPHCGCPVAEASHRSAAPGPTGHPAYGVGVSLSGDTPTAPASDEGRRKSRQKKLLVIGSVAAVVVAGLAVWLAWRGYSAIRSFVNSVTEPVEAILDNEPPPPREPPESKPAPSGSFESWAQKASAAMATEIDDQYRKAHLATSLLSKSPEGMDLLEGLLGTRPRRQPPDDREPRKEPKSGAYESQYESLYEQCLAYVRKNVAADGADPDDVRKAARRWANDKKASLDKEVGDRLGISLDL